MRNHRFICNICHGLVGDAAFVLASCSCTMRGRCAMGVVEDSISRGMSNGACQVMCPVPDPALHEVARNMDPRPLLQ